jgi:ABC-type uncharacterized transport system substrate-binding protein
MRSFSEPRSRRAKCYAGRRSPRGGSGIRLAALVLALALAQPLTAQGQQAGKVARVGVLVTVPSPWDDFRRGLQERGWIEGRNLAIEWRDAKGVSERLPSLAAELVRLNVDVVVTSGDPGALAVRQSTSTTPIVTAVTVDPISTGLAASLARPGGNVTGLSIRATETGGKRLTLLREANPRFSRFAVIWNSTYPGKALELKDTEAAARAQGVDLHAVEIRRADDFERAFEAVLRVRPNALIVFSEPLTLAHQRRIVDFALRNRLPMMISEVEFADSGGLMTYGPSLPAMFHRAAAYVDISKCVGRVNCSRVFIG